MYEEDTAALLGTQIDRYVLLSVLGSGGFGAVYRARHTVLERDFALKVLHATRAASPSMSQRFLREAKAAAAAGNRHIVQVTDAGTADNGVSFLVMELLDGQGLDQLITESAPMDPERAVYIALAILDGLAAAHSVGIVHRDMKPANVFLARDDSGNAVPKLLDFGISRIWNDESSGAGLTQSGMIMGTPQYMAPEQFRDAKVDARADLYAAACILYQMLSGSLPFAGSRYDEILLAIHQTEPAPLGGSVPVALDHVVRRGLSRDPDHRWQSAIEFTEALHRVLRGETVAVPSGGDGSRGKPVAERLPSAEKVRPSVNIARTIENPSGASAQAPPSAPPSLPAAGFPDSFSDPRQLAVFAQGSQARKGMKVRWVLLAAVALVVPVGVVLGVMVGLSRSPTETLNSEDMEVPMPDLPNRDTITVRAVQTGTDAGAGEVPEDEERRDSSTRREERPPQTKASLENKTRRGASPQNQAAAEELSEARRNLAAGQYQSALSAALRSMQHERSQAARGVAAKARCGTGDLGGSVALARGLRGSVLRDAKQFCQRHGIQL